MKLSAKTREPNLSILQLLCDIQHESFSGHSHYVLFQLHILVD